MAAKNKKVNGRPTKYKAEFNEQARKLCLLGATDESLADFFNVSVATINNWKRDHGGFLESLKSGKELADATVAQSLYNRAIGYTTTEVKVASFEGRITDQLEVAKHYPPDSTSAIFWLKNRQPHIWRDRVEQKVMLSDDFDELMSEYDQ
jgi:hypothetical protein